MVRVVKTVRLLYPVNRRTVTYLLALHFYTSDSLSC